MSGRAKADGRRDPAPPEFSSRPAAKLLLAIGLALLAGCDFTPDGPLAVQPIEVAGLHTAWALNQIEAPVDFEFFEGALYILGGATEPELWRIPLAAEEPVLERIPLAGFPEGPPIMLESNRNLLYISGSWGMEVFAIRPDGSQLGAPRQAGGTRDFIPWITGEFLRVGRREGILIDIYMPVPWNPQELRSGWGWLPQTLDTKLSRSGVYPLSDLYIESDPFDQVHALMNNSGALIRYDMWGTSTLVTWLPERMILIGKASANRGYGTVLERVTNGLEMSCGGMLWATVGEKGQQVAIYDPQNYAMIQMLGFKADDLLDANWAECGVWQVGLSAKSGRVVVGRREVVGEREGGG